MIVEGLAVAATIGFWKNVNQSVVLDEKGLKKYSKAFERTEEANRLLAKKAEFTDKRLANVAKKKRAIVQNTVPKFVEVYGKIQKIQLEGKTELKEISLKNSIDQMVSISNAAISVKRDFTDKEFVCGILTRGMSGMMIKDSERFVSAANSQMRAADVVYSQAESIGEIYDAVVARADRISDLLVKMNALFLASIGKTEETIEKNGLNVRNYTEYEKGILMTCVNIAGAVSDLIDIPVVDEKGVLNDLAVEMLETGEQYLHKMNQLIQS